MAQETHRIDALGTDVATLVAIFFLQWMGKATSNKSISNYYQDDFLKPDAIKDSLKRLLKGKVLSEVTKNRRGRTPVYDIKFAKINDYFASSTASLSTQYRGYQKLEDLRLIKYEKGKRLFNTHEFLDTLERNNLDVNEFLKYLTNLTSVTVHRQIPLITRKNFVEIMHGHEFSLDGPLISFDENLLKICQKALSSTQK